jgi:hypothetical protein
MLLLSSSAFDFLLHDTRCRGRIYWFFFNESLSESRQHYPNSIHTNKLLLLWKIKVSIAYASKVNFKVLAENTHKWVFFANKTRWKR